MIKLITHTDLDGISNVILLNLCNVEFEYELKEISELNDYLTVFINTDLSIYSDIYITDLSLNEDIYKLINSSEYKDKFKIFDHHKTHLFAKDYKNVYIDINNCGTSLFYNYLKNIYDIGKDSVAKYVEHVLNLDLWLWIEKNDIMAKNLDMLISIYGKEEFVKEMTKRLKRNDIFKLSSFEKKYLNLKQSIIDEYILKKEEELIKIKYENYLAGLVFASRYKSELGNTLCTRHKELDFVIIINMEGGISLRAIKDSVDLSIIASKINGGGHKLASGAPIPDIKKFGFVKEIFKGCVIIEDR